MSDTEKTGVEAARETAGKLRKESDAKKENEAKEMATVKNELDKIRNNPKLAKLYQDNAKVGAENLAGELPLLKIHAVGRSLKNELKDGSEPNDGWFFYKPTQEQFQEIECHILTISRGFRAVGIEGRKNVFNQIMAGVIVNDGELRPFMFYFTGTKLSRMWDFGKEISKYTKGKPLAIPMFALKVKLGTEKIDTAYNKAWVVNFKVCKFEDGTPMVVADVGFFQALRAMVDRVEDTIKQLIEAKQTVSDEDDEAEKKWNGTKPTVKKYEGDEPPQLDENGISF